MAKMSAQNLKGFRDFLPKEMAVKNRLISILKGVCESYGFDPLETPALEYAETLLGKYGEEADRLVYRFTDRGEREVALRYDLTVPLARVVAQYPDLRKPFKRYQIQPVWRAEKPQRGRFREFTQCDADIVGSASPFADAEVIAMIYDALTAVGFQDFTIRVNSRQVLVAAMREAGVAASQTLSAIQTIDKLDKMPKEEVKRELMEKGFAKEQSEDIFRALKNARPDPFLNQVLKVLPAMGEAERATAFDPALARGLDYYTGPIYEAMVQLPKAGLAADAKGAKMGSLAGGGRYDKLIGTFSGTDVPACGVSFGLDRMMAAISELKLWNDAPRTAAQVLVAAADEAVFREAGAIALQLRREGVNVELYLDAGAKLETQLKYADQKGIPYAVICGSSELRDGTVALKDLSNRSQKQISLAELSQSIKNLTAGRV